MIYEITDLKLDNASLILNETLFHNANGYIGVRSNFEEGYPGGIPSIQGAYINGFYDFVEMKQAEKLYGLVEEKQTMPNVADTQGIRVFLGDEEFSMFTGTVLESKRTLNMEEGYTLRRVLWRSPNGKEAEIIIKRLTSFTRLSLFLIEYAVTPLNFDGSILFISTHQGEVTNHSNPDDPRVAAETVKHIIPFRVELRDGRSFVVSRTARSGLTVCTAVENRFASGTEGTVTTETLETGTVTRASAAAVRGRTVKLYKYTVFSDSIRQNNCENHAGEDIEKHTRIPVEDIYREQREYLREYWDGAFLEIRGDEKLSLAVHYNLYQLIQSVTKDGYGNIAAKGLSGEGYEGHFFWDTEMYIQPFFTLTNPEISKTLIEYRFNTLEEARKNARMLGHSRGALYPWRTIMGKECSGYFPAGTAQYHINGDIAYSIVAYYISTRDISFIAEKGAEIVFETARLWMDTGNYYRGKFLINDVTGPDEYTCIVNNNYYTNVCARYNLYWARVFYEILESSGALAPLAEKIGLSAGEIKAFSHAAENMYLPYDEELGINPQDDSFLSKKVWDIPATPKDKFPLLMHYHPLYLYRFQVCKQVDTVLAHFVFEDAQSIETIRNSFLYYEKITTHDSSLSACIFSIIASKLGFRDKAYMYFGDSAKLDLFDTHRNTKDGIHIANMGGNYMAIVYGFGGLRLKEKGIHFAPTLPEQWEGYSFKVHFRGSRILVEVDRESARFTLLSGEEKSIYINSVEYDLHDQVSIKMEAAHEV